MGWVLLVLGILFLFPVFIKTVAFVLRVVFAILGPLLIIAAIVVLLGIVF